MGYNISRRSIEKVKPLLDQLLRDRTTIKFASAEPDILAYALNQAIRSALKLEDEEYKQYRELDLLYFFKRDKEAKQLVAVYRLENVPENGTKVIEDARNDIKDEAVKLVIHTAVNLIDILASVIAHAEAHEIYFPNAILDYDSKVRLYGWTVEEENNHWRYIDQEDKGVTLTQLDVPWEILFKLREEE